MIHKQIFVFISFVILISTSLAQVTMPLTKYFFTQPNSTTTEPNNAFLTDPGSMARDTVDNSYYNVLVKLGSQKEQFSLVIDTASSFDLVVAPNVESNYSGHHFDCNSSSTCSLSNLLFPIAYEDGTEVQGSIIDETLYLTDSAQVKQSLILVTNNNISFLQFPGDGQLGLEQRPKVLGISAGLHTVVENLQSQGVIPSKSFGIYLSNATNDNSSSQLVLGGYNLNYMASNSFAYYPLATDDAWELTLSSVTFGSSVVSTSSSLTFDSRCSGIVAKRDDYASLLKHAQSVDPSCASKNYGGETFISCNCTNDPNDYKKFPTVGFVFNGKDDLYYIYSDQYVFHDIDGNCVLGIEQAGLLDDSWAVGHNFMKNYYLYFDQDNNQIGIVAAKPNQ